MLDATPSKAPTTARISTRCPPIVTFEGPLSYRQVRAKVQAYSMLFDTPARLRVSGLWMRRGSGEHVAIPPGSPRRVRAIADGFLQVELNSRETTLISPEDIHQAAYELAADDATDCPRSVLTEG